MKLTRSWLEHYIDVPFNTNKLCNHLTMAGLEVDSVNDIKNDSIIDIENPKQYPRHAQTQKLNLMF